MHRIFFFKRRYEIKAGPCMMTLFIFAYRCTRTHTPEMCASHANYSYTFYLNLHTHTPSLEDVQ